MQVIYRHLCQTHWKFSMRESNGFYQFCRAAKWLSIKLFNQSRLNLSTVEISFKATSSFDYCKHCSTDINCLDEAVDLPKLNWFFTRIRRWMWMCLKTLLPEPKWSEHVRSRQQSLHILNLFELMKPSSYSTISFSFSFSVSFFVCFFFL